jgi:hypothetical protein
MTDVYLYFLNSTLENWNASSAHYCITDNTVPYYYYQFI